jgi:hypothetical protein
LGRNWGLQFEAGYAFRRVDHLSGSGRNVSNAESIIWEGDWGMKTWTKDKPWTHVESEFPSNYWRDDHLLRRARDFRLDLSGFQLTVGIFIRL